jgi:general secretion pathway protein G
MVRTLQDGEGSPADGEGLRVVRCPFSVKALTENESWRSDRAECGVTLIELIIVITMMAILSTAAIPVVRFEVKRVKERELRRELWEMRDAIDHYKDAADKGGIQTKADSFNYPPDLQTLVDGVEVQTKEVRFLRKIPIDPMTGNADWDTQSMQDDPDDSGGGGGGGGGENVFDVRSKSGGTALDGTKYNTW